MSDIENKYLARAYAKMEELDRDNPDIPILTVLSGIGSVGAGAAGQKISKMVGVVPNYFAASSATDNLRRYKGQADLDLIRKYIDSNNLPVEFVGNSKLERLLNKGSLSTPEPIVELSRRQQAVENHLRKDGIQWKIRPRALSDRPLDRVYLDSKGWKPQFSTQRRRVRVSRDALMHELGHSKDFTGRLGKVKMGSVMAANRLQFLPLLMYANEDTRQYSTAVMAALQLPTLRSEVAASRNAYNAVKLGKGKLAASRMLSRSLIPAFSTYAIGSATKVVATEMGRRAANRASERIGDSSDTFESKDA